MRPGRLLRRAAAALLALTVCAGLPTVARVAASPEGSEPVTVILVRHAEKAPFGGDDPGLSEAGMDRARALAAALRHAGVTGVVTSPFRRTRDTAQPLAEANGIRPVVAPLAGSATEHVAELRAAVRRLLPGVVLVVGHADTVPALVAALNGPELPAICEEVYDTLLVLYESAGRTRVLRTRYGPPSPLRPGCS